MTPLPMAFVRTSDQGYGPRLRCREVGPVWVCLFALELGVTRASSPSLFLLCDLTFSLGGR